MPAGEKVTAPKERKTTRAAEQVTRHRRPEEQERTRRTATQHDAQDTPAKEILNKNRRGNRNTGGVGGDEQREKKDIQNSTTK
jgi:hypothetical protein